MYKKGRRVLVPAALLLVWNSDFYPGLLAYSINLGIFIIEAQF